MKRIYTITAIVFVGVLILYIMNVIEINYKENECNEETAQILEIIQSMDITVKSPNINIAQEDEKNI